MRAAVALDPRPGSSSEHGMAPRVCVVGPGTRFLSGISYYTNELCSALSARFNVSAVLMRQLLPRALYPGRDRVGGDLTRTGLPASVSGFDGIDWWWVPSLWRALRFLERQRPEVVVMQWWTGTVLHSYLALALWCRLRGARVVIEFHETLDTAEERLWLPALYARLAGRQLFRTASAFVAHSHAEAAVVRERYGLPPDRVKVVPPGPRPLPPPTGRLREAPDDACNLLYFGVLRPYKGVDDLIRAFSELCREEAERYWLTIVGETWESYGLPAALIEQSPHRDRITFINRYVNDDEAAELFAGADVVVLPYLRSSQSGPLHMAMAAGLPVVVTAVGGLVETAGFYPGSVTVAPRDPDSLLAGIRRAAAMVGDAFVPTHDWDAVAEQFGAVLGGLCDPTARATRPPIG